MQISHLFTALLAVGLVSATPIEENLKSWSEAAQAARNGATTATQQSTMQEDGAVGTEGAKVICRPDQNKAELWIQRKATTGGSLTSPQCNGYMQEQINNCEKGDSGERNGWYFR
ncbi:uncharacterized protein N7477_005380 [Penicillium maclennaniae]|uniref:uncharacterized protein n=1 Tax=Penicillium maclennaniae TaxID=1343394 RepID=UPI00253F8A1E|nr:uncharacterized protein N7477_005380 [Penicillium maclennaniae]KAJ5670017.1 hypothetical protein N7477_005380 [Penicillium maclennaniae]